jgi:uncharacterized protein YabN with tetrapyrrole methylase and pyrophosphatase domain
LGQVEVIYNGKVHYVRPKEHPLIKEVEETIKNQKKLYGYSLYSIKKKETKE